MKMWLGKQQNFLWHGIASGDVIPCEACIIAKAKQQNVPKYCQDIPAMEKQWKSNGGLHLNMHHWDLQMKPIYQAIPIGESLWVRKLNWNSLISSTPI